MDYISLASFIPNFDFTINVPTIVILVGGLYRLYKYVHKILYEVDTMWVHFIKEHPDYVNKKSGVFNG